MERGAGTLWVLADPAVHEELLANICRVLEEENITISEPIKLRLSNTCNHFARRARGIQQSRDALRKAVTIKDHSLSRLEQRIKTLETDLECQKEAVRFLRTVSTVHPT